MKRFVLVILCLPLFIFAQTETAQWDKFELTFTSSTTYENPLQDVKNFNITFTAPSGRTQKISGFWDGETTWKARFCPNEKGDWSWTSDCSDQNNSGLHNQSSTFKCLANNTNLPIYQKGSIKRALGQYHLAYADDTPFFWLACTAWNGALRSSKEGWDTYLQDRADKGYTAIQLVTTQWRGCVANVEGQVAFTGSGRIAINPDFFKRIDERIDQVNEHGLVAAPVLLWTLQFGRGRELSPGYYLPDDQAVLLADYMVARYGGNQVAWILGGDGRYINEYEQRWKEIGRRVFTQEHPGIVIQHPQGSSWYGEVYKDEHWLDVVGYQSSHSKSEGVINWLNKGPMANSWDKLPARPLINLEPCYELIHHNFTATDVRNASYWSIFATPIAGITYGHNSIWPWLLHEGEPLQNHNNDAPYPSWRQAIKYPGSQHIAYLAKLVQQFEWWNFMPAQELLVEQPGDNVYNHFIAIARNPFSGTILAYLPVQSAIQIYNAENKKFKAQWFNPVTGEYSKCALHVQDGKISAESPIEQDMVLVLVEK